MDILVGLRRRRRRLLVAAAGPKLNIESGQLIWGWIGFWAGGGALLTVIKLMIFARESIFQHHQSSRNKLTHS